METTPSDAGRTGVAAQREKLWCTNGTKAELLVVIDARRPRS